MGNESNSHQEYKTHTTNDQNYFRNKKKSRRDNFSVTASDFRTKDALVSDAAELVVR